MSKKTTLISLIVIAIIGSFVAALAGNMFMGDILNKGLPVSGMTFFATFPSLMVAALLVAVFLYVLRLYQRPKTFKRMSRTYLIIAIVLSAIGFVTAILCGAITYGGKFLTLYPFPGYLIIAMLTHLLIIAGAIVGLVMLRKVPQDEEKFKVRAKHVFKTLGWYLFISLTFYKTGMFLGLPVYVHWRTLYMTFPFYIWLLVPVFMGTIKVLNILGIMSKKLNLGLSIGALALHAGLSIYIILMGRANSMFVSNISQCMPLERLAAMPVEMPIHVLAIGAVGVILLVQAIKALKQKAE